MEDGVCYFHCLCQQSLSDSFRESRTGKRKRRCRLGSDAEDFVDNDTKELVEKRLTMETQGCCHHCCPLHKKGSEDKWRTKEEDYDHRNFPGSFQVDAKYKRRTRQQWRARRGRRPCFIRNSTAAAATLLMSLLSKKTTIPTPSWNVMARPITFTYSSSTSSSLSFTASCSISTKPRHRRSPDTSQASLAAEIDGSENTTKANDTSVASDEEKGDGEEEEAEEIALPLLFRSILSSWKRKGDFLDMLALRLLSEESALAVKTIRRIVMGLSDHGIIDVFSLHPARDIMESILALSRLQRAALYAEKELNLGNKDEMAATTKAAGLIRRYIYGGGGRSNGNDEHAMNEDERELLSDLAHYAIFANAAYGWKGGLASARLHMGDLQALMTKTGVQRHDIIAAHWTARTHRPAYFIARDVKRKKIVLCIRGTLSARDILTDLCCTAEDFFADDDDHNNGDADSAECSKKGALLTTAETFRNGFRSKYRARAHHGMLESARGVARMTRKTIASELAAHPDYNLVIVGHSLGGGTAAVLGTMWKDTFPGLTVYAYGSPCVGPLDADPASNNAIISVVGEGDPFSCLSLGHLADISSAISQLCSDQERRRKILMRTLRKVENMTEEDLIWSYNAMESLRKHMTGEKFYPPGRIMHMAGASSGDKGEITLVEVTADKFRDLMLHPRMFDLSRHVPNRYETALTRLWSGTNREQRS